MTLRIERVTTGDTIIDWLVVHNTIIPADPLTANEVVERLTRNLLEVAYLGEVLIGCTTVRPPGPDNSGPTVIARVLPAHRGQGHGTELYDQACGKARLGWPGELETVVWESNVDGLRFAQARGFVEVSRYLPDGADAAYLTLRQLTP